MHRMMAKEPVWAYVPVFVLVEFFEVLCNYAKAVSAVSAGNVSWVVHAPPSQQGVMTILTYVGWSILPLVSPSMAVADMDMTRRRNGEVAQQHAGAASRPAASIAPGPAPKMGGYQGGYQGGSQGAQPTHGAVNRPAWVGTGAKPAQTYQRPAMEPLSPKQELGRTVSPDVPLASTVP
jgi:hypothetical protein